jgi:hypothetical protein
MMTSPEGIAGPTFSSMAIKKWSSLLVLLGMIAGPLASMVFAQVGGNVPTIRVETQEVLVPVIVGFVSEDKWYESRDLSAADFLLFEDGKEQTIQKVAPESSYGVDFVDNLGARIGEWASTPKGKWSHQWDKLFWGGTTGTIYIVSYVPPPSASGSCHEIKVKVAPSDANGDRFADVQMDLNFGKGLQTYKLSVDRRQLLVFSRTDYCNCEHASSDPLNGTKVSKQMERYELSHSAEEKGTSVQASAFYRRPGSAQVHVALDLSNFTKERGAPGFEISLLGMAYRDDGSLAARFSDGADAGCIAYKYYEHWPAELCEEEIPNHYETQIDLPPGNYDLRVVTDFDGALREARAPVSVDNFDGQHLAVGGIALCKRFHEPKKPPQAPSAPMMPFEFVPLISKGVEFTPAGDTRFKRRQPVMAYFEVYEPLVAGTGAANAQFEMRVTDAKTGEVKADTGWRSAESWIRAGNPVIPVAEQVATDKLASGTYRLEVQATDSAGSHTPWRTAFFTVE